MTVALRVVGVLLATGAGSALCASPAAAGGVYQDKGGFFVASLYNVTPYTMYYVDSYAPNLRSTAAPQNSCGASCWGTWPGTEVEGGWAFGDIKPGGYQLYGLRSFWAQRECLFDTGFTSQYNAWITYRFDVLGGPSEYVTVAYAGTFIDASLCMKNQFMGRVVYNTVAPPPPGWNPDNGAIAPAAETRNPQITFADFEPLPFDETFGVAGNWSVDAGSPLGRKLDDALNSICGAGDTEELPPGCSFTQTGPLTWGIGAPTAGGEQVNCQPTSGQQSWIEVEYTNEQTATLTVGGSVTLSTEANLFGVIGSKISVEIEAEHEWTETSSFSRTARIYTPPQEVGLLWTAPTIGTVKGTLVLKTGTATFTVTNFTQTRSGVTKDDQTPAFATITSIREASPKELAGCPPAASSRVTRAKVTGSATAEGKPALFPGRGVARVRLGQPRDARRLGRPLIKSPKANNSATANDCRVLDPRCRMVPGRGGTWVYDDLNVVFGADRRVSALFYSGHGRSAKGVGVGSSLRAVRAAYPRASCVRSLRQANCTLKSTYRSRAVQTVFHFIKKKSRLKCDRVMVYNVDERRGEVGA